MIQKSDIRRQDSGRRNFFQRIPLIWLVCACLLPPAICYSDDNGFSPLVGTTPAQSSPADQPTLPETLAALQGIKGTEQKQEAGFQVRADSQKEAALSYGLRGGLAWRTYQINQRLERFADPLSRTYNFRQLLMGAPGGVYVEPPVVEEQLEALKIADQGQSAALTDKILTISANARLVTTARDWRTYLERTWGRPDPPPNTLLPKTPEEQANWATWVKDGWQKGIEQADDIFTEDLARLNRDFTGMVRYRKLLAEAVVSAPYAGLVDRGVTGGGLEMRIGDRAVTITGPAQLKTQSNSWRPISIQQPQ
jgi:defect-in-organelle-trafficking protein DotC